MPREAAGAGWIYTTEYIPIDLPAGAGQVSSVLSLPRGFADIVRSVKLIVKKVATGAGATRTFNVRKGNATGTVIATGTYVLADGATVGAVKDIPVTAGNAARLDGDDLTIEWAAAGAVAFTAGEVIVAIKTRKRIQQLD